MDVIQERDDSNAVTTTYTRDGNIGGILSKRDDNGDDYFFHYDGSGNVVGLTDESQNSVAEYAYDAYGNLLSSSGAQANKNAYRYSTKEYFSHVGLYNYGLRFYSSGLGRWINRDPIAEAGGLNLYGFVANNPVSLVDAYGLSFETFMQGFGTGFLVGGIASFVITAAIAATGGVAAAVILGVSLGVGAYGLMQTIDQLMSSNLCPDERDRIIGELLGGLLGGMLGGWGGARAGAAFQAVRAGSGGIEVGSIRNVNPTKAQTNCANCTVATDAALSGRRASALPSNAKNSTVLERYFGGKFRPVSSQAAIESKMIAAGDGARGIVLGGRNSGHGHVFNVVNQGGKIRFLDGQTGKQASFKGYDYFQLMIDSKR